MTHLTLYNFLDMMFNHLLCMLVLLGILYAVELHELQEFRSFNVSLIHVCQYLVYKVVADFEPLYV